MGCQTQIARDIVEAGADYLLSVKDNQPTLHRAVKDALAKQLPAPSTREKIHIKQGHGCIEIKESHLLSARLLAAHFPEWPELKTLGVVVGYRQEKGKSARLEYCYYISSAELTEGTFAQAVRGHWQIENNLHGVLDVSFREDNCQIYRENAAENIAILCNTMANSFKYAKKRRN
ncbi:ISAs1 family transposase [Xenorhabdus miraniensis]|uniref:Transposase IS4-like domain-containing protein n=1 Tax=Xenorhabdus miraniensis TaxID=351674 RepID=A0A2D0JS96_9GAMM|nr:hypothetical protein Xmir_01542 [Xenorhabdus miraniensis]